MIELAGEHQRAPGDLLPLLDVTERAFVIGDPRAATPALTALGAAFDCELPFATREDFNAFAAESSATLVV
jgi:hypothetical protein